MSFWGSFEKGSDVADDWITDYKKNKEEEIENKMFRVGNELGQTREMENAEGEKFMQEGMDFLSASRGDIVNGMLETVTAGGGKVDDQTYAIAYSVADGIKAKQQEVQLFNDRRAITDAKISNYENMKYNRNRSNNYKKKRHQWESQNDGGRGGVKTNIKLNRWDKELNNEDPKIIAEVSNKFLKDRGRPPINSRELDAYRRGHYNQVQTQGSRVGKSGSSDKEELGRQKDKQGVMWILFSDGTKEKA